jgi:hypothetical protein
VRLDRVLANPTWVQLFPNASVNHFVVVNSDQMGILVDLHPARNGCLSRQRKFFRFDHTWIREVGCEDVIKDAWCTHSSGTHMFRLSNKIKQCRV